MSLNPEICKKCLKYHKNSSCEWYSGDWCSWVGVYLEDDEIVLRRYTPLENELYHIGNNGYERKNVQVKKDIDRIGRLREIPKNCKYKLEQLVCQNEI